MISTPTHLQTYYLSNGCHQSAPSHSIVCTASLLLLTLNPIASTNPSWRPVGKGSEQGAYLAREAAAATTETAALALWALWRLPGAHKRRERERARGCGDDDGSTARSFSLLLPSPLVQWIVGSAPQGSRVGAAGRGFPLPLTDSCFPRDPEPEDSPGGGDLSGLPPPPRSLHGRR